MVSMDSFLSALTALTDAASASNALLQGDDRELLHVTSPHVYQSTRKVANNVSGLIQTIASRYAARAATATDVDSADSADSGSSTGLTPTDIVFDDVCETVEDALEQFNAALDEARGIKDAIVVESGPLAPGSAGLPKGLKPSKRQAMFIDMEKPQVHFPDYPIDNSDSPFIPPYSESSPRSGNAPDASEGGSRLDRYMKDLFKANSNPGAGRATGRKHPYEDEIKAAAERMSQQTFKEENTAVYRGMDETPCTFVTTEEELFTVAERLKRVTEIAVDIENHSIRSFQGFICLIQISTRREDFILDALALRGSIHRALAPIFADESTVKVLHGADKDVQWLERDFGMYIVNMFDTGQAARLLKFPSASLAFLQTRFCNITATNKRAFQLADWRQRPLPDNMFAYARSDTHYLLYIYDRLRTELIKKEALAKAWGKSAAVARKRHSKLRFDAGMARQFTARYGLGFDRRQTRLLEELCRWRDRLGREEDESLHYVAPLNVLFDITRAKDNARTVEGLLKHGFPSGIIPPMVSARSDQLTRLVCDALDAKLEDQAGAPEQEAKADHPQELTNTAAGNPEGNSVNRSAYTDGVTKPDSVPLNKIDSKSLPKQTALPHSAIDAKSIKVSELTKSVLFDMDSSDSSEDEDLFWSGEQNRDESGCNELSPTASPRQMTGSASGAQRLGPAGNRVPMLQVVATQSSKSASAQVKVSNVPKPSAGDVIPAPETVSDTPEGQLDGEQANSCSVRTAGVRMGVVVSAAPRSVFDLSDDDSGDEAATAVGALVQSQWNEAQPKAPSKFAVETDGFAIDEETKSVDKDTVLGKRAHEDVKEEMEKDGVDGETIVALRPSSKSEKKRKKKRRKGKKVEVKAECPAERVAPFDYRKARIRRVAEEEAGKAYQPMQRLVKGQGDTRSKVRKSRKSPASGVKSMSFRAR